MLPNSSLCFKAVGSPCCNSTFIKYGNSPQGKQRYRCNCCGKTQVATYTNKAYQKNTNTSITKLLREGVGILGTARLLEISPTTVLSRIRRMAENIKPPPPLARGCVSCHISNISPPLACPKFRRAQACLSPACRQTGQTGLCLVPFSFNRLTFHKNKSLYL